MGNHTPPKTPPTLFDHHLSGGQSTSWSKPAAISTGCEVISTDAESQLLAMAGQFVADTNGWHALVLHIPGFLTHQWDNKTETLEALIPQLITTESRVWLFLLQTNTVVVLLRVAEKTKLVSFVQRLAAALSISNQPPRTRLLDMSTQQALLRTFAEQEYTQQAERTLRRKEALLAARIQNLSFTILPDILQNRARRTRPVVLVVEDDPTTAQLLEHLINQKRNIDVHIASTAEEAAVIYRRTAPDLVFLDIGLPDIDGLTLLNCINKADATSTVVMLTANAYRENLERATKNGAKGFMAKPFTPVKLAEVISRHLKRS